MHVGQLGVPGDVEVSPPARGGDLAVDAHPQTIEQGAHHHDNIAVTGIDIHHRHDAAHVGAQRRVGQQGVQLVEVVLGRQLLPARRPDELLLAGLAALGDPDGHAQIQQVTY